MVHITATFYSYAEYRDSLEEAYYKVLKLDNGVLCFLTERSYNDFLRGEVKNLSLSCN